MKKHPTKGRYGRWRELPECRARHQTIRVLMAELIRLMKANKTEIFDDGEGRIEVRGVIPLTDEEFDYAAKHPHSSERD